ncbi:hypothetical protein GCM10007425_29140 [Lysinibacillus alkalisoli]|uniref:Uncharacterized protein n=1 Tax=Lysinibacillus alkalisoli TaxID=1911548 RepID=A0A917GAE4_9BACI|nr:hypothetical protein [Lysinibacillus alkalisoli]GGG32659.1 hypothetical protein GCM10007425_29140 [Lysinibacillus alkalisoli]
MRKLLRKLFGKKKSKSEPKPTSIPTKHKRDYEGTLRPTPGKIQPKLSGLEFIDFDNYSFKDTNFQTPTDRQLAYATKLGIPIPDWASKSDVSVLITRFVEDKDFSAPNPDLVDFANMKQISFSGCAGKKYLYNTVFDNLSDYDKVAFFAFSLYRWLSGNRHGNLETSPLKATFYEFANTVIEDTSFMNSLKRYKGSDLRIFGKVNTPSGHIVDGGSTQTIAYKKTSTFLQAAFNTPLKRSSF